MRQENVTYTVDSESHLVQGPGGGERQLHEHGRAEPVPAADHHGHAAARPPTATRRRSSASSRCRSREYSPTSGTLIVQLVQADGITGQPGIPVTHHRPRLAQRDAPTQRAARSSSSSRRAPTRPRSTRRLRRRDAQPAPRRSSTTVNPGTISSTPIQLYDRAGLDLARSASTAPTPAPRRGITISNGGIPNPSTRTFAAGVDDRGRRPVPVRRPRPTRCGPAAARSTTRRSGSRPSTRPTPRSTAPVLVPAGGGRRRPTSASRRSPPRRRSAREQATTLDRRAVYVRQIDAGCNTSAYFYGAVHAHAAGTGTTRDDRSRCTYARNFPYGTLLDLRAGQQDRRAPAPNGIVLARRRRAQRPNTRFGGRRRRADRSPINTTDTVRAALATAGVRRPHWRRHDAPAPHAALRRGAASRSSSC